ncbi:hypothetical protein HDV05_005352 [Chytridiales sp. JEL 0842]|nr:hypothetical protein HDV05_005352 [Chytridiales sp. JEL 0842]
MSTSKKPSGSSAPNKIVQGMKKKETVSESKMKQTTLFSFMSSGPAKANSSSNAASSSDIQSKGSDNLSTSDAKGKSTTSSTKKMSGSTGQSPKKSLHAKGGGDDYGDEFDFETHKAKTYKQSLLLFNSSPSKKNQNKSGVCAPSAEPIPRQPQFATAPQKNKPAIGNDTDPSIFALSKPLAELSTLSLPSSKDLSEITIWRRLHMNEAIELMTVVDFFTNFGEDFQLGWSTAKLSLEYFEDVLYTLQTSYKDLLTLYNVLLCQLHPRKKQNGRTPSLSEVQAILIQHFANEKSQNTLYQVFATIEFPLIPPPVHCMTLVCLVESVVNSQSFRDLIDYIMEEMDTLRKDRYLNQRKQAEIRTEQRQLEELFERGDSKNGSAKVKGVARSSSEQEDLKSKQEKLEASLRELESSEEEIRLAIEALQKQVRSSNSRLLGFDRNGSMYTWLDVSRAKTTAEAAKYLQKNQGHRPEGVNYERPIFGMVVERISTKYYLDADAISLPTIEIRSQQTGGTQWSYPNSLSALKKYIKSLNERGVRERELMCAVRDTLKQYNVYLPYPISNHNKKGSGRSLPEGITAVDESLHGFGEWARMLGKPLPDLSTDGYLGGSEVYQAHMLDAARKKIKTLVRVCGLPTIKDKELLELELMQDFVEFAVKSVVQGISTDAAQVVRERLTECTMWSTLCHSLAHIASLAERGRLGKLKSGPSGQKVWGLNDDSSDEEGENEEQQDGKEEEESSIPDEEKVQDNTTLTLSRRASTFRATAEPPAYSTRQKAAELEPAAPGPSARELRASRRQSDITQEISQDGRMSQRQSRLSSASMDSNKKRTRSSLSSQSKHSRRQTAEGSTSDEDEDTDNDTNDDEDYNGTDRRASKSKKARVSSRTSRHK